MKIIIFGANGMLGSDLYSVLISRHKLWALVREDLDITSQENVHKTVSLIKPDIVINCAAYTDVDKAEEDRDKAMETNALGPMYMAQICEETGAKLMQISTDYVFSGTKSEPYIETDKPNPLSVYGESKAKGEKLCLEHCRNSYIIRTAWLFGRNGKNFVDKIVLNARLNPWIKVVSDQVGSPTYTVDLAFGIMAMIEQNTAPGIYHLINSGTTSRCGFAEKILETKKIKSKIIKITLQEADDKAKRPKNSALRNSILPRLRLWDEALKEYLTERH